MVRVLSDAAVAEVLSLSALLPVVSDALRAQGRGEVERPERPHFPVGIGVEGVDYPDEPAGTALTMPAYLHGSETYATKLASVHEGNAERGLPTVNAQIALTDAKTGQPLAYVDGTRITNARTGCLGGLAARELSDGPVRLGLFGAGAQARWQARAVAAATDLDRIRVYSPSGSREACADDLAAELSDVEVSAVDSPREAVADATVVITATTATEPVFPGDALEPGTLVIAVGAYTAETQELDAETVERAARVFADVPEEVAEIGDVLNAPLDPDEIRPFSAVLDGHAGREAEDEVILVESVGTAVLDAASAEHVYDRAREEEVGETVSL